MAWLIFSPLEKNKCLISDLSAINSQMSELSDQELLQDYRLHKSETAFAALVQRHVQLVYSVALRQVGVPANAEEITQLVFITLARKAGGLRPEIVLEGWLHETTRLTALTFLRGERRRQLREQELHMQSTLEDNTNDDAWNQFAPLLDEGLSRLKAIDRDAVMLRFFKNQSLRDVAAGLNLNEAATQKRVHRAVEKLRLFFSQRGVVFSAAVVTAAISKNSVHAAPAALAKTVTTLALAPGAVVQAGAFTALPKFFELMATTTAKTAIVLSVIGTLAVTGIYEAHQASVFKDRARSLEQQQIEPAAQLTALREQNRQLLEQHARLQQTIDEQLQKSASDAPAKNGKTPSAATSAREKAEKAKETARADGQEFLATNSQGRAMLIDIGRAQIARNYAPFYRMAKLTPAQIEEFENATNAQWMSTIVMTPNSVNPEQPNLPDERARAILGEAGFAQLEQFRRLQPIQSVVNQISNLSPDAPLSRDQSAQLLAIFANTSPTYQSGGKADPKTIDWNQAEAQARSVLTESQLEALHAQSLFPSLMTLVKGFYENRAPTK